jgi:hypothetical protein
MSAIVHVVAFAHDMLVLAKPQNEGIFRADKHPGVADELGRPSAKRFSDPKRRLKRSSRSVRACVVEFPADGSSVQINGTPMPFQITEIIRMLIVVLPNSQLVRSIARTHGLPRIPSSSTTTRAVTAPSSSTC